MSNLVITKGKTFEHIIRWEQLSYVYRPITAIVLGAPTRLTVPAHLAPDDWRVVVATVKGTTELNAPARPLRTTDWRRATVIDPDTIELNEVNSAFFTPYQSGGYLQYHPPVDLTGYTARMKIKDKIGGSVLEDMTDVNGKIVLDAAAAKITLKLDAATTAAYPWKTGVFDLEMESPGGFVTGLLAGSVRVDDEVTTP